MILLFQSEVNEAVGTQQFGLQKDGAGRLHRLMSAQVGTRSKQVVGSIDVKDAFTKK